MRIDEPTTFPRFVDVEPFDPCNLKCAFCFGPDFVTLRNKPHPPAVWRETFTQLAARGVEGIVVSGGEPTMYRGKEGHEEFTIVTLLAAAKELGLRTTMSTNTTAPDVLRASAPFLDWVAIPLDAISPGTQQKLRGFVTSPSTLDSLVTDLRASNPSLRVKLGSVATAWNLPDIVELGEELATGHVAVDTWKIYQFAARRMALTRGLADSLRITDSEFADLRSRVDDFLRGRTIPFRITWSSLNDRSGAYLFVYSNGELVIPNLLNGQDDHSVGNVFEEGAPALDRVVADIAMLQSVGHLPRGHNDENYLSTY